MGSNICFWSYVCDKALIKGKEWDYGGDIFASVNLHLEGISGKQQRGLYHVVSLWTAHQCICCMDLDGSSYYFEWSHCLRSHLARFYARWMYYYSSRSGSNFLVTQPICKTLLYFCLSLFDCLSCWAHNNSTNAITNIFAMTSFKIIPWDHNAKW